MPLTVHILNREQVLYQGQAESVSGTNDKGKFDVLGEHANFIAIIKDEVVVRPLQGRAVRFPVDRGVMRVYMNEVKVFLGGIK